MARFLPLTVTDIGKTTRDAVVVSLRPRPEDAEAFRFIQGQYLTFRHLFDGVELRRSYSICAGLDDGCLQVAIKQVAGGAFSNWANETLAIGDTLEAMPPMGRFYMPLLPEGGRHYLMFAGGSGITPILSILKTVLVREPHSRVTLVYANRQIGSIMFREELEDLKNTNLGRLSVLHVLESGSEIALFAGRVDADKMRALFAHWIDPTDVDAAFICGPEPMMLAIADSLRAHGLSDEQIKFELFAAGQPGRAARPATAQTQAQGVAARVTLDGVTRDFVIPSGATVLDAALQSDMDAPYACKAGVCSTCRAKVTEGAFEMLTNHALEDYEVRAGYVLTCQCVPLGPSITLTYDA